MKILKTLLVASLLVSGLAHAGMKSYSIVCNDVAATMGNGEMKNFKKLTLSGNAKETILKTDGVVTGLPSLQIEGSMMRTIQTYKGGEEMIVVIVRGVHPAITINTKDTAGNTIFNLMAGVYQCHEHAEAD